MALKSWPKRALKSRLAGRFVSFFVRNYIRLVWASSGWRFLNDREGRLLEASSTGFIVAFWHEHLLMAPILRKETDRRFWMLISANRDGEVIANAVAPFGIEFVRGSTANPKKKFKEKSGAPAVVQMATALRNGDIVGVTPDGPRGPRRSVQAGVIRLSLMTGAPILPVAYATSNGRRLGTWDRFWLALPFSKGVFVAGDPIEAPSDNSSEQISKVQNDLSNALNSLAEQAVDATHGSPS